MHSNDILGCRTKGGFMFTEQESRGSKKMLKRAKR